MSKTAIVTGGTRGIGESISIKLKEQGVKVIANYASNDDAAKDFSNKTGIQVMKWDVSKYEECKKNVEKLYSEFENIDILVNNAGITKDAPLHKMPPENWTK